jgi:hypothetical protein
MNHFLILGGLWMAASLIAPVAVMADGDNHREKRHYDRDGWGIQSVAQPNWVERRSHAGDTTRSCAVRQAAAPLQFNQSASCL